MKYYSTNNRNHKVSLREAVIEGLAPDNGLYMPEYIPILPDRFFHELGKMSFQQIAFEVASHLLKEDVPEKELRRIVEHTIQFDAPIVEVESNVYALELFHGPTLAFKDFGARFMSQLLRYFASQQDKEITILVATSGDTGSAVANGFLGVPGTRVIVLYPAGKVSEVQEKQFTTLGENVTALEVDGTFDDCQRLVKLAFLDAELKKRYFLTSANSINISRLIPQSFYYFHAYNQLKDKNKPVVFSVPSGNFGNLPVQHFIAATNVNDIVPEYLQTRIFNPRPSKHTISNAMDVGNPSNFARLIDLFDNQYEQLSTLIKGYAFTDDETRASLKEIYEKRGYLLDPHGAVGLLGIKRYMKESKQEVSGIFLETAHPGKFKDVVDNIIGKEMTLPPKLQAFMKGNKYSIKMSNRFDDLKALLVNELVSK
jgi:threonine synthase